MLIYGITGRSGSGKSTAAKEFERYGLQHVDADKLVHELQRPGTECTKELARRFGEGILGPDGGINRRVLAPIVFANPKAKADLERIVYKYLGIELARIERESKAKGILLDAIRLIESGRDCPIIAVVAPERMLLSRIMARDGITHEEAQARLRAQKPDHFYTEHADYVIINDGDAQSVARQVDDMAKDLGL